MEAFWAITLGILAIRSYWQHSADSRISFRKEESPEPEVVDNSQLFKEFDEKTKAQTEAERVKEEAEKARKEVERQREREIAELRKQGYSEEIIAVILPTINNGQ